MSECKWIYGKWKWSIQLLPPLPSFLCPALRLHGILLGRQADELSQATSWRSHRACSSVLELWDVPSRLQICLQLLTGLKPEARSKGRERTNLPATLRNLAGHSCVQSLSFIFFDGKTNLKLRPSAGSRNNQKASQFHLNEGFQTPWNFGHPDGQEVPRRSKVWGPSSRIPAAHRMCPKTFRFSLVGRNLIRGDTKGRNYRRTHRKLKLSLLVMGPDMSVGINLQRQQIVWRCVFRTGTNGPVRRWPASYTTTTASFCCM